MSNVKALVESLRSMKMVDLSHQLEEDMPVYPTHSRYFHTLWDSHATGSIAVVYQLVINEHCGTHMDATGHFLAEDHTEHRWMADTDIAKFHGRALTLDFTSYKDTDLVSAEEIQAWETANYAVEEGDIVIFQFGWDRFWKPRSVDRTYTASWPGISGEAAQYLVSKKVKGVGCDTLAIDSSYSDTCPAHYTLMGNGLVIIENLTNLQEIAGESYLFATPLKIKEGSGSPIRAVAFI